MRSFMLVGIVVGLAACGEDGTEGAKVAEACVQSDLIAQCPAGTAPQLDARAKTLCDGNASVDILDQNGAVSGRCQGEGSCTVLCNFPEACACGVESFTAAGDICADCGALPACGDNVCEGMETPASCPADCGPCPSCGDGTCDEGETCETCEADCGACSQPCCAPNGTPGAWP